MIDKSILFQAKAFLCWDKFPRLSIKLIPIEKAVAFFYPAAGEVSTIHLFYEQQTRDFSEPLFLLFHEAGHLQQWQNYSDQGMENEFLRLMDLDRGTEKVTFEREAWLLGKKLLLELFEKINVKHPDVIKNFDQFRERCLASYR